MGKSKHIQRLECLNPSCDHIIHNVEVGVLGQEGKKVVRCPACGDTSWHYIVELKITKKSGL